MTVKESVIRKMTRLAVQYKAVNLSQGFPNEAPPWKLRLALAHGVLTGQSIIGSSSSNGSSGSAIVGGTAATAITNDDTLIVREEDEQEQELQQSLINLLQQQPSHLVENQNDQLNQYSPPMGRPDLRQGISDYYQRFYGYSVSPDDITVTLGATEAFASALRTVGRPGDKCVIFEPFHELYPAQCNIFYLEPVYVTLRASDNGTWMYDKEELQQALSEAKILLFNSPHNPTGKVFSRNELEEITQLCRQHDVTIITDEIYEHMCFDTHEHYLIPKEFPDMAKQTLVCNSLGKSASATGWRLGWCLHPSQYSDFYRGIHDQMAVMSPHPVQYAALSFLTLPHAYFGQLAARYHARVKLLADTLQSVGFQVVLPQGAYYLFVNYRNVPALRDMENSLQAAMYLLETVGVACVPGDNFYGKATDGQDFLRFAACRSDSDLQEACKRLQKLKE